MSLNLVLLTLCLAVACGKTVPCGNMPTTESDQECHMDHEGTTKTKRSFKHSDEENDAAYWRQSAAATLLDHLSLSHITTPAKNIIFFVGDGLSVPTITAARIYMGQQLGYDGEEQSLAFDKLPYTGMTKTYCVNIQVADSACTATALLSGVKNNIATLGVTARVVRNNCTAQNIPEFRIDNLISWAQAAGKRTGVVTNMRVTHATPAAAYAHTANRAWEDDVLVRDAGWDPTLCVDVAKQLVTTEPGKSINVILGGGRRHFRPSTATDEEGVKGHRLPDSEDLIARWQSDKAAANKRAAYVWKRDDLLAMDSTTTDHLLGLFDASHLAYHLEADAAMDPTLAEMTETAIRMLEQGPQGYVLFVEGGLIDYAHHDTKAVKALDETVQMSLAVEAAMKLTDTRDTLIVVTSDHGHTMSINQPTRGSPIFSAPEIGDDGLPYATLSYANGPGYKVNSDGSRWNLSLDDLTDKDYMFPAMVPKKRETHGGEDVVVFASGPWAHLFTGTYEQHFIPHAMAYAACIGHGKVDACSGCGNYGKVDACSRCGNHGLNHLLAAGVVMVMVPILRRFR